CRGDSARTRGPCAEFSRQADHAHLPLPPGGSTDITMRALAEATAKHLPQPIVIENKPGAGGTLGIVALQSARPEGYVVTQIPLGAFRIPHTQKVTWDPTTDI